MTIGPRGLNGSLQRLQELQSRIDALTRRWGDAWAEHWLRGRGLERAASRLVELQRSEHLRRSM